MSRMGRSIAAFLLFLPSGFLITAQTSAGTAAFGPSKLTLTDVDNGKDIDLAAGSTLVVKLPSNPSTGYTWTLAGDPSPLKLQKTIFHRNPKDDNAVGAPGTETFQLSAKSAGMAMLTIVYRRSWEYNIPPAKTFAVHVNVH